MKKGVSEFVFKAIFVTVVGAIILMFFFKFAFQQVDIFGKIDVRELVVSLDHELEALSVTPNSNRVISLGKDYDLEFQCNNLMSEDYKREIEHIVFAPSNLRGNKLYAWTKLWKFPFGITNFYYLANDKTKFVVVYDKITFDYVTNLKIPKIFNVQYVNINRLDLDRIKKGLTLDDQVIFVFFTKNVKYDDVKKTIQNSKVISVDNTNYRVRFHDKNTESFYLFDDMLIGAMFDPDNYDCVKDLAVQRLNMVTDIYKAKAGFLTIKEQRENCKNGLSSMNTLLGNLQKQKTKELLYDTQKKIADQNEELEGNNCVTVF